MPTEGFSIDHTYFGGTGSFRPTLGAFLRAFSHDVVVFNCAGRPLLIFCALRWLLPIQRCRIVALDTVLDAPHSWLESIAAFVRRVLFRKVYLFINYFTDLAGYERFFGIGPARSVYVPFKVNLPNGIPPLHECSSDGDYILTAGRSHRDLGTFLAAMGKAGYPGVLLYHDPRTMKSHGTLLNLGGLPGNVRAVDYGGEYSAWIACFHRAKLVVVPNAPDVIAATGISTYLVAMALRKCVIITEGPATRNLLTDQAIVVPPSDPDALAAAIRRAWEDDELRQRVANAGRRYAEKLGDEARLMRDVVMVCYDAVSSRRRELRESSAPGR